MQTSVTLVHLTEMELEAGPWGPADLTYIVRKQETLSQMKQKDQGFPT